MRMSAVEKRTDTSHSPIWPLFLLGGGGGAAGRKVWLDFRSDLRLWHVHAPPHRYGVRSRLST